MNLDPKIRQDIMRIETRRMLRKILKELRMQAFKMILKNEEDATKKKIMPDSRGKSMMMQIINTESRSARVKREADPEE